MQSKFEHGGAVNIALLGKFFQTLEKRILAAECNHKQGGHAL